MKRTKEILFIAICIFLIWFITCDRKSNSSNNSTSSKEEINRKKMDSDSIKFRVDTIYKERVKVVTRWKTIRHDSLIPCEEKLLVCDTIIKVDSTLISELRQVIKADSVVISKQDTLIHAQDLTIIDLTKSVKKEKRQKRLIAGLAVLIGIVGLTK